MIQLYTKIIALLFILVTSVNGYCQLTLEDIFLNYRYSPNTAEGIHFLHHQPLFLKLASIQGKQLIQYFTTQNKLSDEWELPIASDKGSYSEIILSHSDNYILAGLEKDRLYRYSSFYHYTILSRNGMQIPLSEGKQIYPTFSPDDKWIAYIKGNNLFYKDIACGKEFAITTDGTWNKIINGKSDWVYEEEFILRRAYEWNAKSNKIAYLKFDEREVPEYSIPLYYDLQYPNYFTYKYPKTGKANSKTSLWWYDIKSKKNKQINLPYTYEYIPRIYWNGEEIVALLLNRHQDTLRMVSFNINTKETRQLYLETNNTYIDIPVFVEFLSDHSFIITSEKDTYNHLYHYDKDGQLIHQLTNGPFEIKEVYGVDMHRKLIYFQSNESIGNATNTCRSIFQVNYETGKKEQLYTTVPGVTSALFSPDFSHYIRTFSNIKTPPIVELVTSSTNSSVLLEDNSFLRDSLAPLLPQKYIDNHPGKDGKNLNNYTILPNDSILHISATTPQPVLFYVYGGPGNEEVINQWNSGSYNLFLYYLAQKGIKVICLDPRGSGGQGAAFKKQTYLHLGKYETEDILDFAKGLKSSLSIDSSRLGIYGWSYGGFLAANCLLEGNDIFKVGIAGAPVTNWDLYNTIYTERYMRTPLENPKGYNTYNPNALASKLKGNLLLVHGTADDNVHFQHSVQFINILNAFGKDYTFYMIPDAQHGAGNKKSRYDLHKFIYNFLKETL